MRLLILAIAISFFALNLLKAEGESSKEDEIDLGELLRNTIVPEINFTNKPVDEALAFLVDEVEKSSGIKIVIKRYTSDDLPEDRRSKWEGGDRGIDLKLNDVPAIEALRYVTLLRRLEFLIWGNEVAIFPSGTDAERYKFSVREVTPFLEEQYRKMGVPVFENGFRRDAGSFLEYLKVPRSRDLKPLVLEDVGIETGGAGSFMILVTSEWDSTYLVMYGSEVSIDLVDALAVVCWAEPKYYVVADSLELLEGWKRVERVIELAKTSSDSGLRWPIEVGTISMLASTLEKLETNPDRFEITSDEVAERIEQIRASMQSLADRYIESLRVYGDAFQLLPEPKIEAVSLPEESALPEDPFADLGGRKLP